jgi:hypothetical protein
LFTERLAQLVELVDGCRRDADLRARHKCESRRRPPVKVSTARVGNRTHPSASAASSHRARREARRGHRVAAPTAGPVHSRLVAESAHSYLARSVIRRSVAISGALDRGSSIDRVLNRYRALRVGSAVGVSVRRGWRWLFPSPRPTTSPSLPRFVWHLMFPPDIAPGAKRPRRERRRQYLDQREAESAAVAEWEATATPWERAAAAKLDAQLDAIALGVLARSRHRDADTGMTELDLTAAAIATAPVESRERPRARRRSSSTRRSSSGSRDSPSHRRLRQSARATARHQLGAVPGSRTTRARVRAGK